MGTMGNQVLVDNAPGKNSRELTRWRYVLRFSAAIIAIIGLLYLQRTGFSTNKLSAFVAVCAGLIALDWWLIPVRDRFKTRERAAEKLTNPDSGVAAVLNRLPENWLVLHNVRASLGTLDYLVVRSDGAIFAIETKPHRGRVAEDEGDLLLNDKPFEKDLLARTHTNVFWLREFFKGRFGVVPWVNAAMVFPNAYVSVRRTLRGVDVLNLGYLERWMSRARGNPEVARKLRGQMPKLKSELLAKH